MADEEKEVETSAEQPKKKSPIILIVVLVIVGLVLAVGISTFVMKQMMEGANEEEFDENKHHDPGIFLKLGDPKEGILVNVGGPRGGKYLKAALFLK